MSGPLSGIRIVEMAGIGPGPFAAMMFADHGAEVIRVDRLGPDSPLAARDPLLRSRKQIKVDLKSPAGITLVRDLVRGADAVMEGFRPGVMERLGLGPDILLRDNPKLVYGRMTGWGQSGPLAPVAGHDINYIALTGALHAYGRQGEKPTPPINMVGDFGGGAMMLVFGMLSALLHVRGGGAGQVVDCAMTDGSAMLMAMVWGLRAQGLWRDERGTNMLDTGSHFYDTYETSDGKFISIASLEPQFYALLREKLGLSNDPDFDPQMKPEHWPEQKAKLTRIFLGKTRDDWCALMEGTDICFAPVLSFDEALVHPHNVARQSFVEAGGVVQPAPAPRYSSLNTTQPMMAQDGSDGKRVLEDLGFAPDHIAALQQAGVIG